MNTYCFVFLLLVTTPTFTAYSLRKQIAHRIIEKQDEKTLKAFQNNEELQLSINLFSSEQKTVSFKILTRTKSKDREVYLNQHYTAGSASRLSGAVGHIIATIYETNKKLVRSKLVFECTCPSNILQFKSDGAYGDIITVLVPPGEPVEIEFDDNAHLTVYKKPH